MVNCWNYVYDIGDHRSFVNEIVINEGLPDHKEYFFRKIEACVVMLNESAVDSKVAGFDWETVDDQREAVERLYEAAEEIIEVNPDELADPEIGEVLANIPPQKAAPVEVTATSDSIRRKPASRLPTRVSEAS